MDNAECIVKTCLMIYEDRNTKYIHVHYIDSRILDNFYTKSCVNLFQSHDQFQKTRKKNKNGVENRMIS